MITTPFGLVLLFFSLHGPCEVLNSLSTITTDRKHTQDLQRSTYPELVIMSWRALFNESTIVCCNISMMRIFLQHIYLQFYFFLFILKEKNKTWLLNDLIFSHTSKCKVTGETKVPFILSSPSWMWLQENREREITSVLHSRMDQGGVPACSSTSCDLRLLTTSLGGSLLK